MIDQGDVDRLRDWAADAGNRRLHRLECSAILRVLNGIPGLRCEIRRLRRERDAIVDFYLGSPSQVSARVANPDDDPTREESIRALRRMAGLDEEEYSHV